MVGADGRLLDGPGLWTGGPGLHDDLKLGLAGHTECFEALLASIAALVASPVCVEPGAELGDQPVGRLRAVGGPQTIAAADQLGLPQPPVVGMPVRVHIDRHHLAKDASALAMGDCAGGNEVVVVAAAAAAAGVQEEVAEAEAAFAD